MFYGCIERMAEHCGIDPTTGDVDGMGVGGPGSTGTSKGKFGHRLAHLAGLRVRVGRYLGLGDDGFVILPHDMQFPS